MITIKKTYGVRGVADDETLLRLQEVIALSKKQFGMVGKVIIDTEKITCYKFGMKLGQARHSTNGFVVNEEGIIRHIGFIIPEVLDRQVLTDLYVLFGKRCPF